MCVYTVCGCFGCGQGSDQEGCVRSRLCVGMGAEGVLKGGGGCGVNGWREAEEQ